jgi:hypothetical protein
VYIYICEKNIQYNTIITLQYAIIIICKHFYVYFYIYPLRRREMWFLDKTTSHDATNSDLDLHSFWVVVKLILVRH